jgi:uncharacterized delta-60 repeat protein
MNFARRIFAHRLSRCAAMALTFFAVCANAAHPGIDATFGVNGFASVATPGNHLNSVENLMSAVSDSAGRTTIASYRSASFSVARFLANGTPDPAFNGGAAVVRSTPLAAVRAFTVDATGRSILAALEYHDLQTVVLVYRLRSDGQIDSSFGESGRVRYVIPVTLSFRGEAPVPPARIIARPDGGCFIVLSQVAVIAFSEDGAVDTSYGDGGLNRIPEGFILAALESGEVIYADVMLPNVSMTIHKLSATGALVAAYGGTFATTLPSEIPWAYPRLGGFDASGRLVFLMHNPILGGTYLAFRLTASGALDTTFGDQGVATISLPDGIFGSPRLADVSPGGEYLIVSQYRFDPSTARYVFLLLDTNGAVATSFGGQGLTRFEAATPLSMTAIGGTFSRADNSIAVIGFPTGLGSDATSMLRLRRFFTHQITLSAVPTNPGQPKFGDAIALSVVESADQGRPGGALRMRKDDGSVICELSMFRSYSDPNHAFTCTTEQLDAGTYHVGVEIDGDHLYSPVLLPGPSLVVGRAKFDIQLTAHYNEPLLPKERFLVSVMGQFRTTAGYIPTASVNGTFIVTDGVASCQVPARVVVYAFEAESCSLSLKSPGTKTLAVRHLGDPNFEEQTTGGISVVVQPAITSAAVLDAATGDTVHFAIQTDDPHCGLRAAYGGRLPALTTALPLSISRSRSRNNAYGVLTVSDCTPGFSGAITVSADGNAGPISSAWVIDQTNGWAEVPAVNRSATVQFIDNQLNDAEDHQNVGRVETIIVPQNNARDALCIFEALPSTAAKHGLFLMRLALGIEFPAAIAGTGLSWDQALQWYDRVRCPDCQKELDVNGNGVFDISDALYIERRLRGGSTNNSFNLAPPFGAGRSAAQIESFVANGCRP